MFGEALQRPSGSFASGNLCRDIAHYQIGDTEIGAKDAHQIFVVDAFAHQERKRKSDAFLENLARIRRPQGSADVRHVRNAAGPSKQPFSEENRRNDCNVRKMAGRQPRVVAHAHVAGAPLRCRPLRQKVIERPAERHVERRNADGVLSDRAP